MAEHEYTRFVGTESPTVRRVGDTSYVSVRINGLVLFFENHVAAEAWAAAITELRCIGEEVWDK